MQGKTPGESVECAPKCGSGNGGDGIKCDHQGMRQVADEFYKLARSESDGHYREMLTGLRAAASITGDDELVTHINRHMDQLKTNKPA